MKIAVIFPGIGYHTDKPLLYYSKKLAKEYGYEIKEVSYGPFPDDVKQSPGKMEDAFRLALEQTNDYLKEMNWDVYDNILFISKSVGTVVASAYAKQTGLDAHHIYYTPVEPTFSFIDGDGIVFTGTKDPWVHISVVERECRTHHLPLYITNAANHSLETGDTMKDLQNLQTILSHTQSYLEGGIS